MFIPSHILVFAVSSEGHKRARIPRRMGKPLLAARSMHRPCENSPIPVSLVELGLEFWLLATPEQMHTSNSNRSCCSGQGSSFLHVINVRGLDPRLADFTSTPDRHTQLPSIIVGKVLRPVIQATESSAFTSSVAQLASAFDC